jgi:molybdate transport system substrate-binding protein
MPPADGAHGLICLALLAPTLTTGCTPSPAAAKAEVQVAAASDLSVAFEEMAKLFEARTGQHVTLSFGASGALAKQLSQGAPFDLFAAASASYVESTVRAGACDGTTKALYARGHVVAWARHGGPTLRSLSDLKQDSIRHIAIANPEHAPYGKAAKEALINAKLWPELEGKIVQAENVRQALQFAESGNADVALVARSLVLHARGTRLEIDEALHAPIEQTLVVCRHGKNTEGARRFAELIDSPEGQALLARHGFGGSR